MPKKHSPCIINLDELKNIGTHWVCCMPADKHTLWYFASFGMHYPKEFEIRAKKDKLEVLYNTSQYQDIKSVLCGYSCILCSTPMEIRKRFL